MKEAAQPEGGKKDGVDPQKVGYALPLTARRWRRSDTIIREGHIFQTVLSQRWTVETGRVRIFSL